MRNPTRGIDKRDRGLTGFAGRILIADGTVDGAFVDRCLRGTRIGEEQQARENYLVFHDKLRDLSSKNKAYAPGKGLSVRWETHAEELQAGEPNESMTRC